MKSIYETNTIAWLYQLSQKYQRPINLASIPDAELDVFTSYTIDTVWLMGVWQRSPLAVEQTKKDAALMEYFRSVLPHFTDEDVTGSPYAVKAYDVDSRFGGRSALAIFRQQLQRHGIALLLDFVPNHTALDASLLTDRPDCYITSSTPRDGFYGQASPFVAQGKDPYFAPWQDTAQLNPFSQTYRRTSILTLRDIATLCDGVRCDMAMLLLNDIAVKTWGNDIGAPPASEYWHDVIAAVKETCPDFTMIAECYWGTETELLSLGFDYCYDKPLYDSLRTGDFDSAKELVKNRGNENDHLVHFLENHDEDRAASAFSPENERQSATFIASIPGLCLWHYGQFEGNKIKAPIHLRREVDESPRVEWQQFYASLLHE